MPANKNMIDSLHDQMPALFNTQQNTVWKALIGTVGESDQETLELIEAVRNQFFVKTASRPYLDRLGAANMVQRPRFIGMDDPTFRRFIPVMAYNPKQVKAIFDDLVDIFYNKESTTSYTSSILNEPFSLKDGWELEYEIDSYTKERIVFNESEFTNIGSASAIEVVSVINRQASGSYAIAFENAITKKVSIRIFTNTVGARGSVAITGGRANIAFQFDGFNTEAGFGTATEWQITKIGDSVTMTYTGNGEYPGIDQLEEGDVVIIDRAGNAGSFLITELDAVANYIKFNNLFATPETFTTSSSSIVRFMTPVKNNVFLKERRAIVWEVSPGEIVVEVPSSPPVVRRNRKGACHINGVVSEVISFSSSSANLTLVNPDKFPETGAQFYFIPQNEIQTLFPDTGDVNEFNFNSRLVSDMPIYTYSSRVGNLLQGITPELPTISSLNQFNLSSANRNSANLITVTTATPHNYSVGKYVIIENAVQGAGSGPSTNGTWQIKNILSNTQFQAYSFAGSSGARNSSGGTVRMEDAASSEIGGVVMLRSSIMQERTPGPYLWDESADFVLSSLTASLITSIKAGTTKKNIEIGPNSIPDAEGRLIFDFGTERQEGPVRYFYKPNSSIIALDPAYIFKKDHDYGSSVTMIRRRGGIQFQGLGSERAPYITDPSVATEILKDLMKKVKSVGIFLNFIVRYPAQYYSTIDVYSSGIDPG
jgi:hypothetical protein